MALTWGTRILLLDAPRPLMVPERPDVGVSSIACAASQVFSATVFRVMTSGKPRTIGILTADGGNA
jgi:hypothetical protein